MSQNPPETPQPSSAASSSSPSAEPAESTTADPGAPYTPPASAASPVDPYQPSYGQPTPPPPYGQGTPPPPQPYGQPSADPTYGGPGVGYGQAAYDPSQTYGQPPQQPYGQQGGYTPTPYDANQQYGGGATYSPTPQTPQPYTGQQPGYGQQPPYAPQGGQAPMSQSDEKLWATLSHISIPFFWFIGPLIVFLVFKDRGPFIKQAALESLNFSILYSGAQVIGWILAGVTLGILSFLPFLIGVAALVLCILAAVATNKGVEYKYPVNWRLVK